MDSRIWAALVSEIIGAIFGWIWIIAAIATPVLVIWAIFGEGRWYYPVISFAVGGFCKALCREYMYQGSELLHKADDRDYAQEWMGLSYEAKKDAVVKAFKDNVKKMYPENDINAWVESYDSSGRFDEFIDEITQGYEETGLKKPYDIVCHAFIENYFSFLKQEAIKQKFQR